jgi:nitrogen fixation protein FixH
MGSVNDMATATRPRGYLTGRAVLVWLVAFFGVVIAVNVLMAKLAIDTMPGTAAASSYEAGNAYNAEISAARDQSARRWQVRGHVERGAGGRTSIEVEAHDAAGEPLDGLAFSATLERPADAPADRRVILREYASGRYRGDATDVAPGQWDLVLQASRGASRMFASHNRIILN